MTDRTWKRPELCHQDFYKKLLADEQKYKRAAKCEGPFCGWTCLGLSIILAGPLLWFCVDCLLKAFG